MSLMAVQEVALCITNPNNSVLACLLACLLACMRVQVTDGANNHLCRSQHLACMTHCGIVDLDSEGRCYNSKHIACHFACVYGQPVGTESSTLS